MKCINCNCDTDIGRLCGQCDAWFRNELIHVVGIDWPDNTFLENAKKYVDNTITTESNFVLHTLLYSALDRLELVTRNVVDNKTITEVINDPSIHRPQSPHWMHEDWDDLDWEANHK